MIRSQFSRTRTGGARLDVAEDMRVAANELRVHAARHLLEIARARARQEQERQEVDLEEQVAELVEQLRVVAASAASATS